MLNVAAKWKEFMREETEWIVGGAGRQKLCLQWWEPFPHHQAEKAFHIFEWSTGWQIISEFTVERDHCNKVCVSNLLLTHVIKVTEKLYIGYKVDSGWEVVCRAMIWQNINKLAQKFLLIRKEKVLWEWVINILILLFNEIGSSFWHNLDGLIQSKTALYPQGQSSRLPCSLS